jgi:hypothetical protein
MGCETYPPIIDFLLPSVVRCPMSNAPMIWQTVFDRHRLLLLIMSADVLWSIKGVGVERRYEGPTTWPRKIVLPFFGWTVGNCRRPFRIVPYTCTFVQYLRTFVLYDGTYGTPD